MDTAGLMLLVAAGVLALVAVAALWTSLASGRAERRRLTEELRASRSAVSELRDRVEELSGRVGSPPGSADDPVPAGFVITSLGADGAVGGKGSTGGSQDLAVHPLSGRDFASVAVTESVVRVVSLASGVRRALSAQNRNRIRFEVRREVRRARRQRRSDLKEARRHLRTSGAPAGRDAA